MTTNTGSIGQLLFLVHPGAEQFSGYGLTVTRDSAKRLVGLLIVDRPHPVSQQWLDEVEMRYGRYELFAMGRKGERGIACQIWVAEESQALVRQVPGSFTHLLQEALFPLLMLPPAPQFDVEWDAALRLWKSTFHVEEDHELAHLQRKRRIGFAMGQIVATPGALMALEEAGQLPQEFLHRHAAGEWGDLDEHDRRANDQALRGGGRLLSAYITKNGTKIWIITEWDRSVTTILLPSEY
jgi:hypothetical protein